MKKGSALILTIFMIALFLALGTSLAKIVNNYYRGTNSLLVREQAFYLAEAGLERAKVELVKNPNWYTDPPYYPIDNDNWLVNVALGHKENLGHGSFKIVREKSKGWLYSIGLKGKGVIILKLKFSNPPFKTLSWEEL
ncbi:hypothetical protein A2291_04495 [candidate division WOR-1 bacterium RIFOXYB2_FULL_42_35]|uniref:Type 4 fimbrial biogenesis protein PilX N-terminal domain-containing protein n=1 Tax=candidate division WOR-1 bacterium RIFOXYC2_FULL_41_25 TaxID=1802586 RepID=A0A1F4TT74_UNCSA|nr:MAG: hypothetical protein A2247_07610 [candidate division WOR-1 bacterium RIFOXYA2_FULL_41_14]OGC25823.1 MAG: hypothetical protein A2291_04495 [candidate division WOR-1 bacterium RIFOXYB2_FULL_42_35]OGC35263.1 MAG: hypothetical protein A2462_08485 [candidate division WOR-1 bacterium RIFOXYC2_FULL_41_25]OGC43444.1 MAG: hypothetical protein A2548_00530 [candidate division WOR-1 bacterium RIFOXYD2_FULL_41_8]